MGKTQKTSESADGPEITFLERDYIHAEMSPEELSEALLESVGNAGEIADDWDAESYLRGIRLWCEDNGRRRPDASEDLFEPVLPYFEHRLPDVPIMPLPPSFVRELLCDFEQAKRVDMSNDPDAMIALSVESQEDLRSLGYPLARYGYEQIIFDEPERDDEWVRVHYKQMRNDRETLARLLQAGVDPETALHYWGGNLKTWSVHKRQDCRRWDKISGVERASYSAEMDIRETLGSDVTLYLGTPNRESAPEELHKPSEREFEPGRELPFIE